MKDIAVRLYQPGDEESIVQLLNSAFDGWPKIDIDCHKLDYWKWKYVDNPVKKTWITVATTDKRIIGCSHGFFQMIKINDKIYPCCIKGDLAVHPDFRRIGVWSKMGSFNTGLREKMGAKLTHAVSGNPIVIKRDSRARPQFPHTLINLVRILDIDAHLKSMPVEKARIMEIGFKTVRFINELKHAFTRQLSQSQDITISEVSVFDHRINEFWNQLSKDYGFIVARTRDYLNWRYCDPRAGGIVVKQAEEAGRILGYSALKINRYRGDYPVGFVVDFLSFQDRRDVAEALAIDAVEYFDQNGVNIVNYLSIKDHPNAGVFNRLGFLDSRVKLHMFYGTIELTEEMKKVKSLPASCIHFSWGDHDSLPLSLPNI